LSFDGASNKNMSALSTGKRYKTLSDVIYPLALQVGNLTLEKNAIRNVQLPVL
jgi:hypothetical protein